MQPLPLHPLNKNNDNATKAVKVKTEIFVFKSIFKIINYLSFIPYTLYPYTLIPLYPFSFS
ncbi:MAG: hypothetical protein A3H98_03305 [Bacteroidetes bacterium RIFCSPLOWO2_02_FULL_36_8]|nr:MAG: hypothetical protein A3H98_03305 [Bacteroidetes bacterium RIFCSPLOWO2_02_FULL_36_8]OFY71857.1 MAG: hypothetical protein A3G23_04850 [Bacteroidetes bacterium RIFCSPLOWO2_12_FULL_37_12]